MEQKGVSPWFMRLRWFAFLGQTAVLTAAVIVFELTLPWERILALLLLIPITDGVVRFTALRNRAGSLVTGGLLSFDILLLTAVLCQAGGPTNPFTIVYLVHVVLSAVLLTSAWTWTAGFLSSVGFGALFLFSIPVPEWQSHGSHHGFSLHLHGMFFAYLIVAFLVASFLSKIVSEVQRNAVRLQQLESVAANQQRLAALTTITAGAAHELGSPLATIAVVSHELDRSLRKTGASAEVLEDVALLKGETIRCKEILQDLAARTGDLTGESPEYLLLSELLSEAIAPLRGRSAIELTGAASSATARVPRKAVVTALRALVKNGIEASDDDDQVMIRAETSGSSVSIEISDSGRGIAPEVFARIGEPFFSTKDPGKGMGLGVYLARLTFERLGGSLQFESNRRRGASVRVSFPIDCVAAEAA